MFTVSRVWPTRFVAIVLSLVAILIGLVGSGTTSARATEFTYDATTHAHLGGHSLVVGGAGSLAAIGDSARSGVRHDEARAARLRPAVEPNAPNRAPGLADDFTDHVVLGKSNGLPANAEKLGGRHLMGSADWQADVLGAISNPNTRISVALDGMEGAGTAHSRVMAAIQRASSGRGSPLDWELMQLHQGGRLSTTGFYEGGNAITNPFG